MKHVQIVAVILSTFLLGACVKFTNIPSVSDLKSMLHPKNSVSTVPGIPSDSVMMEFKALESSNKYNIEYDSTHRSPADLIIARTATIRDTVVEKLGNPSRSELFILKHKDKFSGKLLEAKREAIYYDSPKETAVFLFTIMGDSGWMLIDHFKKPRANYSYPRNIDPNMGISAPD